MLLKIRKTSFIARILTEHADAQPHYSKMCILLLCVPVTSIEYEHAVSLQNRINTKIRNRLREERVDLIMTINMGTSIDSFDFLTVVRHWRSGMKRRLNVCAISGHTLDVIITSTNTHIQDLAI